MPRAVDLFGNLGLTADATAHDIARAARQCRALLHPQRIQIYDHDTVVDMRSCVDQTVDILGNTAKRRKYLYVLHLKILLPRCHGGVSTPFERIKELLEMSNDELLALRRQFRTAAGSARASAVGAGRTPGWL
jgi:hypothetical protein